MFQDDVPLVRDTGQVYFLIPVEEFAKIQCKLLEMGAVEMNTQCARPAHQIASVFHVEQLRQTAGEVKHFLVKTYWMEVESISNLARDALAPVQPEGATQPRV